MKNESKIDFVTDKFFTEKITFRGITSSEPGHAERNQRKIGHCAYGGQLIAKNTLIVSQLNCT